MIGGFIMVCPRCGAELNSKQRYCMKCGALNYEHPDNQKLKQYITEQELEDANQEYQKSVNDPTKTIEIGGKVFFDTPEGNKKTTYVDTRAMLVLLFVITLGLAGIYYFVFPYSLTMTICLCMLFFVLGFIILTNISLYMKGGYSGFTPFIPFYGQYAYFDIVFGNGWLFLISLIPVVGIIYFLYSLYKLGKVFGKSGKLTLFLPFILLPIIAFSDRAVYTGPSKKYKLYLEKGKKRNTVVPAFVCSFLILLLFVGFTQISFSKNVATLFTQKDIDRITNSVKQDISDGLYYCNDEVLSQDGKYYIEVDNISDIQDYPIPIRSALNGKKLSGYFYIKKSDEKLTVSAYMTDGENVFSDDNINNPDDISVPKGVTVCTKQG